MTTKNTLDAPSKKMVQKERKEQRKMFNQLTFDFTKVRLEKNTTPGMTIPDMTMSISDIINKHANGSLAEQLKDPLYQNPEIEQMGVDVRTMDLVDLQNLKMDMEQRVQQIKGNLERDYKKRKQQVEAQLRFLEQNNKPNEEDGSSK